MIKHLLFYKIRKFFLVDFRELAEKYVTYSVGTMFYVAAGGLKIICHCLRLESSMKSGGPDDRFTSYWFLTAANGEAEGYTDETRMHHIRLLTVPNLIAKINFQ